MAGSFNRFYYGTDARMSELLVGVVAALALLLLAHLGAASGRAPALRRDVCWRPRGLATVVIGALTYRNGGAELPARRRVHHRRWRRRR